MIVCTENDSYKSDAGSCSSYIEGKTEDSFFIRFRWEGYYVAKDNISYYCCGYAE